MATEQVEREEQEEDQEEEEEGLEGGSAFHHISELEAHGIQHQDCQKLGDGGYCTVESVGNI